MIQVSTAGCGKDAGEHLRSSNKLSAADTDALPVLQDSAGATVNDATVAAESNYLVVSGSGTAPGAVHFSNTLVHMKIGLNAGHSWWDDKLVDNVNVSSKWILRNKFAFLSLATIDRKVQDLALALRFAAPALDNNLLENWFYRFEVLSLAVYLSQKTKYIIFCPVLGWIYDVFSCLFVVGLRLSFALLRTVVGRFKFCLLYVLLKLLPLLWLHLWWMFIWPDKDSCHTLTWQGGKSLISRSGDYISPKLSDAGRTKASGQQRIVCFKVG